MNYFGKEATDKGLFGTDWLQLAISATRNMISDAAAKRQHMAVQGPAADRVANIGALLSLLRDKNWLNDTELANPTQAPVDGHAYPGLYDSETWIKMV